MPRARVADNPVLRIEDRIEDRDEHSLLHVLRHEIVHSGHDLGGGVIAARFHPERGPYHRHDERSRHALARNVRHDDPERIVVDLHEVVVIPADLLCGLVVARDIVAADLGNALRQEGVLDLLGDLHLFLEAFLLDDVLLRRAELRGDFVERPRDLADLLGTLDLDLVVERALADRPHAVGERLDRPHENGDEQVQESDARGEYADEEQCHHRPRIDEVLDDHAYRDAHDDPADRFGVRPRPPPPGTRADGTP